MQSEKERKKVIFLTSSEYGQANVILAVAYEMLLLQQYEVHIASFSPLESRVAHLNETVPINQLPAKFHTVYGPSAAEAGAEAMGKKQEFIGPFRPGVKGALATYRVTLPAMLMIWDGPTYMKAYQSCLDIIRAVQPHLIIVDPLFGHGLEACNTLDRDCIVLSPNTFQEICRKQQPFSYFCRYPALSCGFPNPVPWHLVPANVYLKVMFLFVMIASPVVRYAIKYRKSQNLPPIPPSFNMYQKRHFYLVPSIPKTDFPCYIPPNVSGCGPILLPVPPVSSDDSALQEWLNQAPTVLINLGTHIQMNDTMARELSKGLKLVLDQRPGLQILWKIKTSGGIAILTQKKPKSKIQEKGISEDSLAAIAEEVKSGRVKLVEWFSMNPLAILRHENVVCSVHHGGSNSFHEALDAGVPQVILPCWFDTLEFAYRVEYLGIGLYGSRKSTPSVESREFSQVLTRMLDSGPAAISMKQKAKELADVSRQAGGRKKALQKILEKLEEL